LVGHGEKFTRKHLDGGRVLGAQLLKSGQPGDQQRRLRHGRVIQTLGGPVQHDLTTAINYPHIQDNTRGGQTSSMS
jgi:hypothetical protein